MLMALVQVVLSGQFQPLTKVPIVNQLIPNFAKVITLLRTRTLTSLVLIMSEVTVPGGVEVYNLCAFFFAFSGSSSV
jgi:hypothetical protein